MDAYSSPIEDTILKEGRMSISVYFLFAASLLIGAGIGSLVEGPINEFLGVKTSLLIFSQLGNVGTMLLVLAYDSISMIVGRLLIGLYTSQVATDSTRNFYGGMLGFSMRF